MQYLNNSHKLEISSGCLLFSLISSNSSVNLCGAGITMLLQKRQTICCWLCYCVSVRNVGVIWHFAMTVGSDHKSAQDGVNERVRDGLLIYAVSLSGIWWDGRDREKGKRNEDKLLRCLKCWSALLWAAGFSLSRRLLHSSLCLSQHGTHQICHTSLRQLSLNTLET